MSEEQECCNCHKDFCDCSREFWKERKKANRLRVSKNKKSGFEKFVEKLEKKGAVVSPNYKTYVCLCESPDGPFYLMYGTNKIRWKGREQIYTFRTRENMKKFALEKIFLDKGNKSE